VEDPSGRGGAGLAIVWKWEGWRRRGEEQAHSTVGRVGCPQELTQSKLVPWAWNHPCPGQRRNRAKAHGDRRQVGSKDMSCRSSSVVCGEPGATSRAIPRMVCAKQSQMPSKSVPEHHLRAPPGVVASSRLAPGCPGRGAGVWEALKDVGWELRDFAEGSSC